MRACVRLWDQQIVRSLVPLVRGVLEAYRRWEVRKQRQQVQM